MISIRGLIFILAVGADYSCVASTYRVVDLGVPSGASWSNGIDVNDQGQVVYSAAFSGRGGSFLYENGSSRPLFADSQSSTPSAINNRGAIVGTLHNLAGPRGFYWQDGNTQEIAPPTSSLSDITVTDVNDAGLTIGWQQGNISSGGVFTWLSGTSSLVGQITTGFDLSPSSSFSFLFSQGLKVNDSGVIVGVSHGGGPATGFYTKAWIKDGSTATSFPALPGDSSPNTYVAAINEAGDILASYYSPESGSLEIVWSGNQFHRLNEVQGSLDSALKDMNNAQMVVGNVRLPDSPFSFRAALWNANREPVLLDNLNIINQNGWQFMSANAINSHGWITGYGKNPSGQESGFLLIPIPEPSSIAILICATIFALHFRKPH